jgi:hypothetical protein
MMFRILVAFLASVAVSALAVAGIHSGISVHGLSGPVYYANRTAIPPAGLPPDLDVLFGYGQSDMTYEGPEGWANMGITDLMQGEVYGIHTTFRPGPNPASNGPGILGETGLNYGPVNYIDGITKYLSTDLVSVNRGIVLAYQMLKRSQGKTLKPTIGWSHAIAGCTWESCQYLPAVGLAPYPSPSGGLVNGPTPSLPWGGASPASAQGGIIRIVNDLKGYLHLKGSIGAVNFKAVEYLQGGSQSIAGTETANLAQKLIDLPAMLADYDALLTPSTYPIQIFAQPQVSNLWSTPFGFISYNGVINYSRAHPTGRIWTTGTIYQWPILDVVHLNSYGRLRLAEQVAYAYYQSFDEAGSPPAAVTPLWESLATPISVSGQTITIPYDRPTGAQYAAGTLSFGSTSTGAFGPGNGDGLIQWPNQGYQVYRNGVALTINSVTIVGMSVHLGITETLNHGDVLTVDYAFTAPAGLGVQGTGCNPITACVPGHMGIGGNLRMLGTIPSAFFPGLNLADAWATPLHNTNVIVP